MVSVIREVMDWALIKSLKNTNVDDFKKYCKYYFVARSGDDCTVVTRTINFRALTVSPALFSRIEIEMYFHTDCNGETRHELFLSSTKHRTTVSNYEIEQSNDCIDEGITKNEESLEYVKCICGFEALGYL